MSVVVSSIVSVQHVLIERCFQHLLLVATPCTLLFVEIIVLHGRSKHQRQGRREKFFWRGSNM